MALLWAFLAGAAVLSANAAQPPSAPTADVSALVQRSLQSQLAGADVQDQNEEKDTEEEREETEEEHVVQEEDLAENQSLDIFGHVMADFVDGQSVAKVTNGTNVTNRTNVTNGTNGQLGDQIQSHWFGSLAHTKLGPILGSSADNYHQFLGIRFAEPPKRFEVSEKKKAWAPKVYDARQFRAPCIGAEKAVETEDCLFLNIWATKGFKDMPVIVYFHGGINQHGTGSEPHRWGDGITNVTKYPTVYVTLDWRLGIFGWIHLEGSNVSRNLGMMDQQLALHWIQENIRAFGGDPMKVTLQGQSEGCAAIFTHMVAPSSKGLFQKAALHSPVANVWSTNTNKDRTSAMIKKAGCKRATAEKTLTCLRMVGAQKLWNFDWVSEALSRNVGSRYWKANMNRMIGYVFTYGLSETASQLGWHADIDNVTLPGDPNELIHLGRFHNVTVLMTTNRNETHGVLPISMGKTFLGEAAMDVLLGSYRKARRPYAKTLEAQGIGKQDKVSLMYQMFTDKLWTCDMKSIAGDMVSAGSKVYFGFLAHEPKYSACGVSTNPECKDGAMCHADEMPYILPQGSRIFHNAPPEEQAFSQIYSEAFLAWLHENSTGYGWVPYDPVTQPITFYQGSRPPFVVPGYRREQCEVLDRFNGKALPKNMRMHLTA